ncbi:MAG: hypothetical protein CM15mP65_18100 [Crocinitomicaceae bacterium]|nr:MAG: hypothetical protein CM15mP65_18100 [Crocinitomicaceae bacterium]
MQSISTREGCVIWGSRFLWAGGEVIFGVKYRGGPTGKSNASHKSKTIYSNGQMEMGDRYR